MAASDAHWVAAKARSSRQRKEDGTKRAADAIQAVSVDALFTLSEPLTP